MNIKPLLILIMFELLMSSCSNISSKKESGRSLNYIEKPQKLCAYREEKGIGELVLKEKNEFYFKFYPGDETISVDRILVPSFSTLHLGDEIKAIKNILVNGDKYNCARLEISF